MAQALQQIFQGEVDLPKCSICLESLDKDMSSIQCGHVFHTQCILQSIMVKTVCPLCRQKTFQNQVALLYHPGEAYSLPNTEQQPDQE